MSKMWLERKEPLCDQRSKGDRVTQRDTELTKVRQRQTVDLSLAPSPSQKLLNHSVLSILICKASTFLTEFLILYSMCLLYLKRKPQYRLLRVLNDEVKPGLANYGPWANPTHLLSQQTMFHWNTAMGEFTVVCGCFCYNGRIELRICVETL